MEFFRDGKGAVEKLMQEKQGQVAGAFYREELGDIDLVWGDSSFGLQHILEKHPDDFISFGEGQEGISKGLSEIIENGKVVKRKGRNEAYNIEYNGFIVGINKGFDKQGENKWIVTAFDDNVSQAEKTAKTAPANDSTKGASLPLNSNENPTTNPITLQANAHLGAGLVSGGVAGIETDENGNIIGFNPAKFAMGFLGGSLGSKSIERLAKNPKARAVMERIYLKKDIMPKMKQGVKVDTQDIIKILEQSPQKGRDMVVIGQENFTPEIVAYAQQNNKKIAIEKLDKEEAQRLGFKHPNDVRVTIDSSAINHTLNKHGAQSPLVKQSGQKAVDYADIAQYRQLAKSADETLFSKDDLKQDVIVSFKQINGYAAIVESIRKKGNELGFKSMYFENGSYKNSNAYKNAMANQKD